MRTTLALFALTTLLLGGCSTSHTYTPPEPAAQITMANHSIDSQRQLKQRLLEMDPYEHAVEKHLNANPRVESARFALITSYGWSNIAVCGGGHDGNVWQYRAVVSTDEAMSLEYARALLRDAFKFMELREPFEPTIVFDGNTWVASGSVATTTGDNPVLTGSMGE